MSRPAPTQPQASWPLSGPTVETRPPPAGPSSRARFAWVSGFSHMLTFIAGASSSGALRGQHDRGQQIVGHPGRQAGDRVGGRRRDDQQVGLVGQPDVPDLGLAAEVEQLPRHRRAGKRLQGQRGDELGGRVGHHHPHRRPRLDQQAAELGGLVGGDAAGDAEEHPPPPS